jgi:hypothetical protein
MAAAIPSGLCAKKITSKADIQTKINEDDVLMNGNQKATQWVVMNRGTADLMAVEIRGKIHIEV